MYRIGEIVIAKNSHKECGYIKGDSILIEKYATVNDGDFIGKNLTRPDIGGDGSVYVGNYFIGKRIKKRNPSEKTHVVKLFGIPLFSIEKVGE